MDPVAIAREGFEDIKTGLGSILAYPGPVDRDEVEAIYNLTLRALKRLDSDTDRPVASRSLPFPSLPLPAELRANE